MRSGLELHRRSKEPSQRLHSHFGNGDVDGPEKALDHKKRYGVDGIVIDRASIGHPWIFREAKHFMQTGSLLPPPSYQEHIDVVRRHLAHPVAGKA